MRQFPKVGTNVKVREDATQIDLLKAMIEEEATQIKQLTDASDKAKKKRRAAKDGKKKVKETKESGSEQKRPETNRSGERTQEMEDDESEDTDEDKETMCISNQDLNVRLYIHGVVCDKRVTWLVDSGSTISVVSYNTWREIHYG